MTTPVGRCHACGLLGPLSFEHVPPEAAFNSSRVYTVSGERLLNANLEHLPRGVQSQRGAGAYTLCPHCNELTGGWYGRAFVDWTFQAARVLMAAKGAPSIYHVYQIYPLKVLKQLVCMFLSANPLTFRDSHPELFRFVLNKWTLGLPPRYRFYAYFNAGGRARQAGMSVAMDTQTGDIRVLSEISFPPLGYVLALSGSPPDRRLFDISGFANYLFTDFRQVSLRLPALPVFTYFPGDFRDERTVLAQRDAALDH